MNKIAGLFAALALLLYTAAPSFAGKKALDEGDLDRITAAGEPTIIQVSGVEMIGGDLTSSMEFQISYEDSSSDSVAIEGGDTDIPGGQQNLRALVLNNIAGETLAANALNIAASSAGTGREAIQSNEITQSWGAIKVTDVVTATESISVEGEDADGGDGEASAGSRGGFCIGICGSRGGGDGGDGDTSPGAVALAAIAYPVFMSADLIIHVEDVLMDNSSTDEADTEFTIDVQKSAIASVAIEGAAQSDLAALVVNNAAGKVLLANAINIAGGQTQSGIDDGTPRVSVGASAQAINNSQSNVINQYRGTPINAPTPAVVFSGTGTGCIVAGGQAICN
jgi:hypothetical protein